jgi:site-specific recombinase XerD
MGQVRAIVEYFDQQDEEGEAVAMSILMAAFWGLRFSETFNSCANDFEIDSQGSINIHIRKTKYAYKRDVAESDVPELIKRFVIEFLQSIPQNKKALSMLKAKCPNLTTRRLRYLIDIGMKMLGLPGTHHTFRHFFINRLLALGYSLQKLADLTHHRSLDTTVSSYTHIAPAIMVEALERHQAEQRAKDDCDDQFIRISQLGPLRGLSDRADQRGDLIARGIEIFAHIPGKGYFLSSNGYYLRIRDAICYLLEKAW